MRFLKSPRVLSALTGGRVAVLVVIVTFAGAGCTGGGDAEPSESAGSEVSIAPAEDYETNMAGCMGDKGWNVIIIPEAEGGGITAEIPQAQAEAFRADNFACAAEFGYDQPPPPMSEEDARAYLAKVVEAAECVEDLGFEVPARPAEQDSLEGLMSVELDPRWDVFANVPDGELSRTQGTCFPDA